MILYADAATAFANRAAGFHLAGAETFVRHRLPCFTQLLQRYPRISRPSPVQRSSTIGHVLPCTSLAMEASSSWPSARDHRSAEFWPGCPPRANKACCARAIGTSVCRTCSMLATRRSSALTSSSWRVVNSCSTAWRMKAVGDEKPGVSRPHSHRILLSVASENPNRSLSHDRCL